MQVSVRVAALPCPRKHTTRRAKTSVFRKSVKPERSVAGRSENASNSESATDLQLSDFETVFEEMRDWEIQLRDLDLNVLESPEDADDEADTPPSKPKRGGPTPC